MIESVEGEEMTGVYEMKLVRHRGEKFQSAAEKKLPRNIKTMMIIRKVDR